MSLRFSLPEKPMCEVLITWVCKARFPFKMGYITMISAFRAIIVIKIIFVIR